LFGAAGWDALPRGIADGRDKEHRDTLFVLWTVTPGDVLRDALSAVGPGLIRLRVVPSADELDLVAEVIDLRRGEVVGLTPIKGPPGGVDKAVLCAITSPESDASLGT